MISNATKTLALALVAGAVAAPGATAMLPGPHPRQGTATPRPAVTQTIVETTGSRGFDYGDAAIGAGAATALLLAASTGTLVVRTRRSQLSTARVNSRG